MNTIENRRKDKGYWWEWKSFSGSFCMSRKREGFNVKVNPTYRYSTVLVWIPSGVTPGATTRVSNHEWNHRITVQNDTVVVLVNGTDTVLYSTCTVPTWISILPVYVIALRAYRYGLFYKTLQNLTNNSLMRRVMVYLQNRIKVNCTMQKKRKWLDENWLTVSTL